MTSLAVNESAAGASETSTAALTILYAEACALAHVPETPRQWRRFLRQDCRSLS